MNNDDLDKLIKRSLNNVAENITLSDPDRLLERINQDILKKSLMIKRKKENNLSNLPDDGKRKKAVVKQTY